MVRASTALALAVAATALPVAAAPPSFEVEYEAGGKECPAPADFRREVSARVTEVHPSRARYSVRTLRADGAWEGVLTVVDEQGRPHMRALRGRSCLDVTKAVAFLTALALELGRLDDEPEPPRPEPKHADRPPPRRHETPPVPPAPARPPEVAAPRWTASTGLAVSARGALASTLRPAGEIFFGLESVRRSPFAPSIFVVLFLGGNAGDASMNLWLYAGRLEACPVRWQTGRIEARPCAGLELGAVTARGAGIASPRTNSTGWVAGDVAGAVRVGLSSSLFVEGVAGVVFPIIWAQFVLDSGRTLYSIPPAAGRLALAIGVRF